MHYFSTTPFGSASQRKLCDERKKLLADELGITLIQIPFWWDKSQSSLVATIQQHRLDILHNIPSSAPIPSIMPENRNKPFKYKQSAALSYDTHPINPTGWFVKLKYIS
jgi:hypothetical protein